MPKRIHRKRIGKRELCGAPERHVALGDLVVVNERDPNTGEVFTVQVSAYELQPITYREACAFIREYHRHHAPPQGYLFAVAVNDGSRVVGVAMIGRPVARMIQDGFTAEVTRVCALPDLPMVGNHAASVCSKLYAAAWRAARALGYRRLITYVLASETGTSVRAAGWREVGKAGGGQWSRTSRPRVATEQDGQKTLWERAA